MDNLDEIFASMPEAATEADREYLVIDPATRTITVPESEQVFGVTGDEQADRKYFLCPRYVGDGLDLAGMFVRVNFRNADGDEDGYLVDDVTVVGDYVTFSWKLWPKVTEYSGTIQFGVSADLPNTADRRFPDWNTTMATGEVLEGLHPYDGDVEEETRDVVTQLRAETAAQTAAVAACGAEQVQAVQGAFAAETAAAVAQVAAKGAATLATIPADYTTLAGTVDRLTRDRAAAIVCAAEGTAIQIQDASNDPLQGLRIFGRSTQDGTPTPDSPVEIVSTPAPVVRVCGKNLLPYPYMFSQFSKDGVTVTANADGTIVVNGTAAANVWVGITENVVLSAGTYTLSIFPDDWVAENGYVLWQGKNTHTGTIVATIKEATSDGVGVVLLSGTTYNNVVLRPKIERGSVATDYEPYHGGTLAITHTLPGIPVASGGNYTDAAGQQWIADEVDLARGVYVQRVGEAVFTGSDGKEVLISTTLAQSPATNVRFDFYDPAVKNVKVQSANARQDILCNYTIPAEKANYSGAWLNETQVFYGRISIPGDVVSTVEELKTLLRVTPIVFAFPLAEPVEAALTDAELQAYRALHSNKPTTTVLNDAGAHMVLEYAADPKTYIDNKLAALVAANN